MSTLFRVFLHFSLFCIWLYLARQLPGAIAPEKPPRSTRNPAMHLGKSPELRQDPDSMRTARRHDHGQGRRQAAPPVAQAGGPGGAEYTPQPRHHAQQADPPTLDSGPTTTTDHRPPGTTSATTIDSSTKAPTPGTDPTPGSRATPRPATAPQSQNSGRPAPTPDDSPNAAQDARRTRQRRLTTIYTRHRRQPARTPPTVHKLSKQQTPHDIHVNVLKKYDIWHISIDNHTITCIMVHRNTKTCKSPQRPHRPRD